MVLADGFRVSDCKMRVPYFRLQENGSSRRYSFNDIGFCCLKVILTSSASVNITPSAVTVMRQDSVSEPALSVAVDFNNRRAINEGRKQVCDGKTVDELYSRVQSLLTSGLQDFLDKGEVRF